MVSCAWVLNGFLNLFFIDVVSGYQNRWNINHFVNFLAFQYIVQSLITNLESILDDAPALHQPESLFKFDVCQKKKGMRKQPVQATGCWL